MIYEEIDKIFNEELAKERKVKTEGKSDSEIASEVKANEKLVRVIKTVKTRILSKFKPSEPNLKKYI